jgi:hypothetical protein
MSVIHHGRERMVHWYRGQDKTIIPAHHRSRFYIASHLNTIYRRAELAKRYIPRTGAHKKEMPGNIEIMREVSAGISTLGNLVDRALRK